VGKRQRTEIVIETNQHLIIRWRTSRPAGVPARTKWELDAEAFSALLRRLDPEPERAGAEYVRIYQRLTKFFECRGCVWPADLADETINRVARRIHEGEEIHADNPIRYFYGVARNVLREHFEHEGREFLPLDELLPAEHPRDDPDAVNETVAARWRQERLLDCLSRCLQELPAESRKLLLAYHEGEKRARIEHRQELAERLGITANALKVRVFRLRQSLERRVNERMMNEPRPISL
jgi:RNA polymerase sigma factor (sigma-70 family)